MTFDLFANEPALERLDVEDAEIHFARYVDLPRPAEDLLREIVEETPWRSDSVTIYGKQYVQPRLIAWYGDPGKTYSYSGVSLEPLMWTPTLLEIRQVVQDLSGETFNSVLCRTITAITATAWGITVTMNESWVRRRSSRH